MYNTDTATCRMGGQVCREFSVELINFGVSKSVSNLVLSSISYLKKNGRQHQIQDKLDIPGSTYISSLDF